MAWYHMRTCPCSSREELGPETHTQVVHECHPLLASLIEEWVHGTYIPFFQLAGSAPGKRKRKQLYQIKVNSNEGTSPQWSLPTQLQSRAWQAPFLGCYSP